MAPDERRSGRRHFFRDGLAHIVGPLADYLDRRLEQPTVRLTLRPPGAILEDDFLDTCRRCGACVEVCPANAIRVEPVGEHRSSGAPYIDPDLAACVLCEGLLCTHECPSGALRPIDDPRAIEMGLAEVDAMLCVRSNGENCTICVDRCPTDGNALVLIGTGPPTILDPGCVGCGVCQLHCPTSPKAIVVHPRP